MVQFLEALLDLVLEVLDECIQLANSVIIFDEIQTLPIKCVHLLILLYGFCKIVVQQ